MRRAEINFHSTKAVLTKQCQICTQAATVRKEMLCTTVQFNESRLTATRIISRSDTLVFAVNITPDEHRRDAAYCQ